MPVSSSVLLDQILVPAFLMFLLVGGLCGLLVGIGLASRSTIVLRWIDMMNRWVSFRRLLKPVEVQRDAWSLIQARRRLLSVLIGAGAIYTIFILYHLSVPSLAALLSGRPHNSGIEWLLASVIQFLMIGNGLAIIAAALLGFAPTLLATLDRASGRWISTRSQMKQASAMHCSFDHWITHWPRATGSLIAVFSAAEVACVAHAMRLV